MISLLVGSAIAWKTSRLMIEFGFRNRLVTQIYMKPFGYTKFFLTFFLKCGKNKKLKMDLIQNRAIKPVRRNNGFYFINGDRFAFHTKYFVAIVKIEVYKKCREMMFEQCDYLLRL